MDHYILNLFKKINAPKTTDIKIAWPVQSAREVIPRVVYDGDTLYAYAFFKEKPTEEVTLTYTLEDGETHTLATQMIDTDTDKSPSIVSRIVANAIIDRVSNETLIIKYSLDYQLFSTHTKYILTDEVPDDMKPYTRPKLHQVRTRIHFAGIAGRQHSAQFIDVPCFMRQQSPEVIINEISDEQLLGVIDQLPGYYVEMAITLLNAWFVNSGKVRLPDSVNELREIGISRKEILDILNDDNVMDFILFLVERYMGEFDLSALDHDFISEVL
jgi:hypothetical protein